MRTSQYLTRLESSAWRAHARHCLRLTRGRCALFPFLRAAACHHLHYRRLGSEVVVFDTVPLSQIAHVVVHLPLLWAPPVRVVMTQWLRLSTVLLALAVRPAVAVVVALLLLMTWTVVAARLDATITAIPTLLRQDR